MMVSFNNRYIMEINSNKTSTNRLLPFLTNAVILFDFIFFLWLSGKLAPHPTHPPSGSVESVWDRNVPPEAAGPHNTKQSSRHRNITSILFHLIKI